MANTCPTPLTVAQLREKSFQKTLEEKTVYFRLAGDIAREPVMSIGTNLDTVLPTVNFRSFHMDYDEITCFASEADLLAFEEFHDVIHPIGDIEVVSAKYSGTEIAKAYNNAIKAANTFVALESIHIISDDCIANRVSAITRHIEVLRDARDILEGNLQKTAEYLKG